MGDRVAIRFVSKYDKSTAFFAHWGGPKFYEEGQAFLNSLEEGDRLEANTVMLNFIVWFSNKRLEEYPIKSSYYLGKDYRDGDCSDNGCYDIDVHTGDVIRVITEDYDMINKTSRFVAMDFGDEEDYREDRLTWEDYKKIRSLKPDYADDNEEVQVSKW